MDLLELIKSRTSCRDYQERAIPDTVPERCLEAARWAPSACNRQPWRFVAVKDRKLRKRLCAECFLPGIPMPWAGQAPVIIALCVQKSIITHCLAPWFSGVNYHLLDLGIAGEHLALEAQAQGLGSCWIGWARPGKIRKLLELPWNIKPVALLTLGYPRALQTPGKRLALSEIASADRWGRRQ